MTEDLAMRAASLYAEGLTQRDIGKELDVSKSRVTKLIQEGYSILKNRNRNPDEDSPNTPDDDQRKKDDAIEELPVIPREDVSKNIVVNGDYRRLSPEDLTPKTYTLETSGTPKRVVLTPKALMIFDIFSSCGFDGDLSDFIEDSIDYLYQTRKPADRRNYGVI